MLYPLSYRPVEGEYALDTTPRGTGLQSSVAPKSYFWLMRAPMKGVIITPLSSECANSEEAVVKRFKSMGVVLVLGLSLVGGAAVAETFRGTSEADNIVGTSAKDEIKARGGDDKVSARRGNDFVYGQTGNDTLSGQTGDDRIYPGDGTDTIEGGDGDDNITANDGVRDEISCGEGTDFVYADTTDSVAFGCEKVRIDRSATRSATKK